MDAGFGLGGVGRGRTGLFVTGQGRSRLFVIIPGSFHASCRKSADARRHGIEPQLAADQAFAPLR